MNVKNNIQTLRGEIAQSCAVLIRLENYFVDFQKNRLTKANSTDEAMIIAQSLTNYFTCIETLFFRISQFFENGLDENRWHQSLLNKMILEIPDCRPRVISDTSYQGLNELLKFRHFTRYYFELNYDWDKLHFLIKKFNEIHTTVRKEIETFDEWLIELLKSL